MLYKFENTEKSINDAVETVKVDVKAIIHEENLHAQEKVKEICDSLEQRLGDLDKVTKKKTAKIQSICKSFFDNYEQEVKHMKGSYIEMRDSFDMWSRNVKKPQELKEAALYALE